MVTNLQDRFRGCLLGLAVGDALGARFEARSPESIRRLYASIHEVIHEQVEKPYGEIWYTDDTIGNVIFLGGDTDTMAAMAGGISGAYLGAGGIPEVLIARLETTPKGGKYIAELADRLFERYRRDLSSEP